MQSSTWAFFGGARFRAGRQALKKLAGTGVAVALLMLALAACAAAANKEPSRAMDSDPRILDFAEVKTPSRPNAWLVAPPGTVEIGRAHV